MKTAVYNLISAQKTGDMELKDEIFNIDIKPEVVHQVFVSIASNQREPIAHTKDRGEVRGGGKKPWKQKGTGRARHGSTRSPIWVGGGAAHGPKSEKDYSSKINKKVKAKALATVLSKKFADTEMIFVDALTLAETKTALAKTAIKALAAGTGNTDLATKRKNAALVVIPTRDEAVEMSFRNFGNIEVMQAKDINPVDLLTYKYVIVANPADTLSILEKRIAPVAATANVK